MARTATTTPAPAGANAPSRRYFLTGAAAALTGAGFAAVVLSPDPTWSTPVLEAKPDAELVHLGVELEAAWRQEDAAWAAAEGEGKEEDHAPEKIEADRLSDVTSDVVKRIGACHAAGITGLLVKLRAVEWCRCGEAVTAASLSFYGEPSTDMQVIASILQDLSTMGSAAA